MRCLLLLILLVFALPVLAQSAPARPLNDTGQLRCVQDGSLADCVPSNTGDAAPHPRQDARFGRDARAIAFELPKLGAGAAGFDFTRICNSGEAAGTGACPPNPGFGPGPNDWACTRDNVTGLVWELKTTDNFTVTFNFSEASTVHAAAFNAAQRCGFTDWRVPTRRELLSILHHGRANPAIDEEFFPNTLNLGFWSSNTNASSSANGWVVNFGTGATLSDSQTSRYPVRLVRGLSAPQPAYVVNFDGTLTDLSTGLTWDRCAWGQQVVSLGSPSETCGGLASTFNWQAALGVSVSANAANHRGYRDWRLPNRTELESLADLSLASNVMDPVAFPNSIPAFHWSSTVFTQDLGRAWGVSFNTGATNAGLVTPTQFVRLVRSDEDFDGFAAREIAVRAGDNQSAIAGTAVPIAPRVLVTDANNHPVAGVMVSFSVASGGGTISPSTPIVTGPNGIAALTRWTLGPNPGVNTLAAAASGLIGSPRVITATGLSDGDRIFTHGFDQP